MDRQKIILVILDGWGIGKKSRSNPIMAAEKPNLDSLFKKYPHSRLGASGLSVGLPPGVMGNSEVGHLSLGAGRIIYQDLVKINKACTDGTIEHNRVLREAFHQAKKKGVALHFIGLVSDAGVHSVDKHLYKLCDLAKAHHLKNVFVHAMSDGRDTDPHSAPKFIGRLEKHLKNSTGQIATLIGRYYTMDRDLHWERIKKGYDLMVNGRGEKTQNFSATIKRYYQQGITDEFMEPIVRVDATGKPVGLIKPNDVVICFNFRTERLREITTVLTQKSRPGLKLNKLPLHYYTLTRYSDFLGVKPIFDKDNVKNTLGEVLTKHHLRQLRIAETEKYAHVTFFFSGGRQKLFPGEKRILIRSPRVATYDLRPEMSAFKITKAVRQEIGKKSSDFICINFANGDMVGHTGKFSAIKKAISTVDNCIGQIYAVARDNGYEILLTADHGNAENAINSDGTANTNHSLNPVPCLLVSTRYKKVRNGILADVAPTILAMMGIKQPKEMTGRPLV
ncbi:MAG: 2,3-bisphosphoglycerate-independent phosphoglycerate mutase [Patescibacteria group bacterium]|jgi:2,3-bisphosphoglycerate-independent phosphoglycerate mutase